RRARLSDNPGAIERNRHQQRPINNTKKTKTLSHNETAFGKFIPTEGPTFPGWPFSLTAGVVTRQRIANLPATPSVAIRRRSYKKTGRGHKNQGRLVFFYGR